jgi:hypothetical protein
MIIAPFGAAVFEAPMGHGGRRRAFELAAPDAINICAAT